LIQPGEQAAVDKAPDAFRTISEVADELDIPQHVLRFWESRFPQIKPMKRAGGRRYYRPDDVDLLRGIKFLLYTECYRIEGVQSILRERGPKFVQSVWQPGAAQPSAEPNDETSDEAGQLAPDQAARALFGLLKAPAAEHEPAPAGATSEREPVVAPPAPSLTHEHVRRLQSALHELRECRHLIEQALRDEAA
jgi:DNA-binding transcriptional MerR regulator